MVDYFSLSNLILDDILFWDGRTSFGVLGGAGSHALAGMRVWRESLGLVARVGRDLQPEPRNQLKSLGVDLTGLVQGSTEETARAWQMFQPDEERIEVFRKQTLPSKQTPTFHQIPEHYLSAKGIHLYWDGSISELEATFSWLREMNPAIQIVWEPATEQLHENRSQFESVLPAVNLFTPNLLEGEQITGEASPPAMIETLLRWGAPLVAIRMGEQGSLVGDRRGNLWRIPGYAKQRIDVTGAGNAYCGGFLVGLAQAEEVVTAACMAAVSASYALEQFGLPVFQADLAQDRQERMNQVRSQVEQAQKANRSGSKAEEKGRKGRQDEQENLERLFNRISVERLGELLESIANTKAPSQTVKYTRAPVIQQALKKLGGKKATFIPDYLDSGNTVIYFGEHFPDYLFFAHADEISYLVGEQQEHSYRLIPYCKHLSKVPMPAIGLRYSVEEQGLKPVARGMIVSQLNGEQLQPYFQISEGQLKPGDRVVFHSPLTRQSQDLISGSIDNAAGVSACLLSAIALSHLETEVNVGFVFSDEEEGPAEHMNSFARGARRLMNRIKPPQLCCVIDGHQSEPDQIGTGALYAEASGNNAGAVTPPPLFARLENLAEEMQADGIELRANPRSVSRGDETAIMETTSRILLLGYPSRNRHLDHGPGQASLSDLAHLTRAICWLALHRDRLID